ncbi:binding protein [Actinidia rufa]|uniref:Binding protein n=1 Tax=Actinidia rufa TaxID=165716 RepID=A0A7J0EC50_9ERIC|nr:binding protein [Actinidia rufa]
MYLKKAFWSDSLNSDPEAQSPSAVGELVNSLDKQRLYREVTLALRTGLRDSRTEFSFLRVRGLRSILKFLRSVAESDSTINLFCHSQSIPDLQVVPVLFQHSLKELEEQRVASLDHIFGTEPMKIITPSTDSEVALALRVLEGCCLLHRESTVLAHQYKAIPDFEVCNGIEEVAVLIRDKQVDENLRLKCGEFLLLLIGHVNGRERSPMATVHEDIRRLLGEKSASLIWAASQFGSTPDPDQRLMALHIQARRVLESLDLY